MARNNNNLLGLLLLLCKFIWKKPLFLLAVVLLGAGLYGCNNSAVSYKGEPQTQSLFSFNSWNRTLSSEAFKVGYSDKRGNPLWVSYKLKPVPENAPRLKRPTRFTADWRAINKIKPQDYEHSGYDRGHLAPNYAISSLYGKEAQLETFVMTNISPQKPNLNRKLWQRLERAEIDYFTQLASTLWVTTGPVFDENIETLKAAHRVEIPDAFYKIYAIVGDGKTYLLAFLMPQTVTGNEPLSHYLVTVDKVEELTGLDFFHELNDNEENVLESTLNTAPWNLTVVNRLPGRY